MDRPAPRTWREGWRDDTHFVRRALLLIGLAALALFMWRISGTILLVFAAILFAVILRALISTLETYLRISGKISFYVAILVVIGALVAFGFFFGAQVRGQLTEVIDQLPAQIESLATQVGIDDPWGELEAQLSEGPGSELLGRAAGFGYSVLGGVVDAFIVIVAAIYLAYDPPLYRRGLLSLVPESNRPRMDEAMLKAGHALKMWFVGQMLSMLLVGAFSGLGYWLVGLPNAVGLGLIAGVTNFIPFVGPFLGAIPALTFAFNMSLEAMLWTIGVVIIVQQLESNLFVPIIQRKAVSLPPALALFAIVAAGVVFGFVGILLAVPLAVAIMVLTRELWIEGVLADAGKR